MKNIILSLVSVLSLTFSYSNNNVNSHESKNNIIIDSLHYINEVETDEPFDFDHKAYLPSGFTPYNLDLKDQNNQLIDEHEDEAFDFDHKEYLPVGFNPSKELNHLFLNKIHWVDEEDINEN